MNYLQLYISDTVFVKQIILIESNIESDIENVLDRDIDEMDDEQELLEQI